MSVSTTWTMWILAVFILCLINLPLSLQLYICIGLDLQAPHIVGSAGRGDFYRKALDDELRQSSFPVKMRREHNEYEWKFSP